LPRGPFGGQGETEHARTTTHVENHLLGRQVHGEQKFGEFFRFRARDQRPGVGLEGAAVELDLAEEVLDRHAFAAQFECLAQRLQDGFLERAVELHVKVHPGALELMGHQQLHVAARVRDAALLQIESAFVDSLENRAHGKSANCGENRPAGSRREGGQ